MKRFLTAILLGGFVMLGLGIHLTYASEVDVLLQKMVEKGLLTASEAQEIRTETNDEVAKTDKQKMDDYKTAAKDVLPDWVKNTKMTGDFRLRYNYDHINNGNPPKDVQRGRMRARLGFETKINDKLTLGYGLATGLASPDDHPYNSTTGGLSKDYARSANQTFTGAFSKKPITLDLAYANYTPQPWISLIAGKMKNPYWDPEGKFIWDDNIRPEGAAVLLSKNWNPQWNTFINMGLFVLDTNTGNKTPMLYAFQPGASYNFNDDVSLKGALSYYNWASIKDEVLNGGSYGSAAGAASTSYYGNSRDANGNELQDFNNLIPQIELGIKHPLSKFGLDTPDIPYFSLFGEYITNTQVENEGTGYVLGCKIGSAKIEKWGDWQLQYDYRMLGRNAIPDILPDADTYNGVSGGTTGIRGHRGVFQWGLGKNTWLAFNVYRDKAINGGLQDTTFYADWNMKF